MKKLIIILCFVSTIICCQEKANTSSQRIASDVSDYLDINNIRASVVASSFLNLGDSWNYPQGFEFPKGSKKFSAGASGVWVAGINDWGQLKVAAQTYGLGEYDFGPGPLNNGDATISFDLIQKYNYVWKISYNDINDFITNYNNRNIQYNAYNPKADLLNLPTELIDNWGIHQPFAKYIDHNNDGKYNPKTDGDYPNIKGDQALYYVFNDNSSFHSASGGGAIGLQVNAIAYAYGCPKVVEGRKELLNTTFYNYKLYNRSNNKLNQAYISIWVDGNIGDGQDDYVGSNPKKGYAYAYNGDGNDAVYGNILPATGTVILKAPKAPLNDSIDNDYDGIIDEIDEELLKPNIFYFNHAPFGSIGGVVNSDPQNASQAYQYLTGNWRDGTPFTCGGDAYGGTTSTNEVFPGINATSTVCALSNWTEKNVGNISGDRCYLLSIGPFTFNAHDSTEIEFAFVTSVDSSSIGNTDGSVAKLENDIIKVKNFYNLPIKPNCIIDINQIPEKVINSSLTIYPNPSNDLMTFSSLSFVNRKTILYIHDLLGEKIAEYILTEFSNTIDISSYSKGMYFASVDINNKTITQKIIKE